MKKEQSKFQIEYGDDRDFVAVRSMILEAIQAGEKPTEMVKDAITMAKTLGMKHAWHYCRFLMRLMGAMILKLRGKNYLEWS